MNLYTGAYAGEFYQDRPSLNWNTLVNLLTTRPARFVPSAQITRVVQFPDYSFYQGEVNYSIMCVQINAAIIRAGQNLWMDDEFERNYLELKACGKKVGVYWFYDDRIDPGRQAAKLVSLLIGKTFEMEVFVDWENSYGGAFGKLQDVVAMMQLLDDARAKGLIFVRDVGLYTGYYWFRAHSNASANAGQYAYLKNKPLWLAWYTTNPDNVLIPAPWTSLTHWQFGTPVLDWGQATKEIDMNFYNGTKQEFDERYGTIGEPTMPDYIELKSNTSSSRSIRAGTAYPQVPHVIGTKIGDLFAGDVAKALPDKKYVYASDIVYGGVVRAKAGDTWWEIYENDGVSATGWIAERHMGETLLTVTPHEPPVPTGHVVEVYIDGVLEFRKELS